MYAKIGNDEHTEMQWKFQDSWNPSPFVTTSKVGGTGLNLTAAHQAVITQKFWVLNKQQQAFARVVQLRQNRVPHTGSLNARPGGNNNHATEIPQPTGVAQMRVLHSLLSQRRITISMVYQILEPHETNAKQLTENGETLQCNEPSILEC